MVIVNTVLLIIACSVIAGMLVYILIKFIKRLRDKKLKRVKNEEQKSKDEMEFEKHKIAESTIKRFRKNYDKLNPIILLDGTEVEFYEEEEEIELESPFGMKYREYGRLGFTYKINDKVYRHIIFFHDCMSIRPSIYLNYLDFEDDYLESNQWIIDEITHVVREKRLELDRDERYVSKLKADVLGHWAVKKIGK